MEGTTAPDQRKDPSDGAPTVIANVARLYAVDGWSVFPLWWIVNGDRCACPGGRVAEEHKNFCGRRADGKVIGSPGKHPINHNGVTGASRDPQTVASWWARYPLANIGLPAGDNNLAIIDVDLDKPGTKLNFDRLNDWTMSKGVDLRTTLTAYTGGGGFHLFFSAPADEHAASCKNPACPGCIKNGQGNKPPFWRSMTGLDTRGCGGYVVAAPSTHISGRVYDWADDYDQVQPWPAMLTRLMKIAYKPLPPPPRAPRTGKVGSGSGSDEKYALAALTREIDELLATKQGGRNGALNEAAFSLGQLVGGGLLKAEVVENELYSAATAIGLGDSEARKTIASGMRAGMASPRTRTAAA
jgi:hypothetical protein